MGALKKFKASPVVDDQAIPQVVELDQYGRDPSSPSEQFRRLSNYKTETGYAPFFASWLADLPRLTSGGICTLFLMTINVMSLGRPDNAKGRRHQWTRPVAVEELASVLRCHVREVQRQIKDCGERGLVGVKVNGRGLYSFSLLYLKWRELPDYQCGRPVAIDEPATEPEPEEEPVEVQPDAVRLCRRPLTVQAGKAGRAVPVPEGLKIGSIRLQNSATLPLVFDAVYQCGQLLISSRLASDWRECFDSERKGNVSRHAGREEEAGAAEISPRARDVIGIFDPLLAATGERLLVGDAAALATAVKAMHDMPVAFLEGWLRAGKNPRADRPISGPRVVASIIREAYANWAASTNTPRLARAAPKQKAEKTSGGSFVDSIRREAIRRGLV